MDRRDFDGAALKAARQRLDLTQPDLAAASGVSLSAIKYLENGERQPLPVHARALALAVGCSVEELSVPVGEDDDADGTERADPPDAA